MTNKTAEALLEFLITNSIKEYVSMTSEFQRLKGSQALKGLEESPISFMALKYADMHVIIVKECNYNTAVLVSPPTKFVIVVSLVFITGVTGVAVSE